MGAWRPSFSGLFGCFDGGDACLCLCACSGVWVPSVFGFFVGYAWMGWGWVLPSWFLPGDAVLLPLVRFLVEGSVGGCLAACMYIHGTAVWLVNAWLLERWEKAFPPRCAPLLLLAAR